MTQAVYPRAIFSWGTDRVNEVSTVWAADVNTLAADLTAVETTLGTLPYTETSPYVGTAPVTYTSVSARISDVLRGTLHPYVSLVTQQGFKVPNNVTFRGNVGNVPGKLNTYSVRYDPYGMFNGTDATVPVTGLYYIFAGQQWNFHNQGYYDMSVFINPASGGGGQYLISNSVWQWDGFASNNGPSAWDATGFDGRLAPTQVMWMGQLNKGDQVRVASQNGTNTTPIAVYNSTLNIYCLRKI